MSANSSLQITNKNQTQNLSEQTQCNKFFVFSTSLYFNNTITQIIKSSAIQSKEEYPNFLETLYAKDLLSYIQSGFQEIFQMLKTNKVNDCENLILAQLDNFLLENSNSKQPIIPEISIELNKIQKILFQICLNLQRIYLLDQCLQGLIYKGMKNFLNAKDLDSSEKKLQKQKRKAIKLLKQWLTDLQLLYQIMKMDNNDIISNDNKLESFIDPAFEFEQIITLFVIQPFGEKLNAELLEIFNEIDFAGNLIQEVKKLNKRTPRKFSRKPCTPSKISKEEIKTGSKSRSNSVIRDINLVNKNGIDMSTQTESILSQILGKRQSSSQISQNVLPQGMSQRTSKLLVKPTIISSQTFEDSNDIKPLQLKSQQSLAFEDSPNHNESSYRMFQSSLVSTLNNTHTQCNDFITSSNEFFSDKAQHIDSIQIVNLSQEMNMFEEKNNGFTQADLLKRQSKESNESFNFQCSQSTNNNLGVKRQYMYQQPYKTKNPKNKSLIKVQKLVQTKTISKPTGHSQKENLQLITQSSFTIRGMIQNRASKVQYTRTKGSQNTTPQHDNQKVAEVADKNIHRKLFSNEFGKQRETSENSRLNGEVELLFNNKKQQSLKKGICK